MQTMQVMKYIVCHTSSFPQVELMQNSQSTTSFRKGHMEYNPNHRYTSMTLKIMNFENVPLTKVIHIYVIKDMNA